MILKIKYKPHADQNGYWVYIGNIKKLEYSTIHVKDLKPDADFDAWYTCKDDIKYGEGMKFSILAVTFDNGHIETYLVEEVAYLLNDIGGTVERFEPWRDD